MLCNSEILGRIQRWKFCVFLLKCVVFVCFTPIFGDTPWIQRCDSLVCLCFLLCSSPPKNGINKGIPLCYLFFIRGEETWFFLYGCLFSSSWMVGFRSKTKITKLKSSLKNKTTNSMYLIYIPKNAITSLTFWKMNPWTHHRKNNIMSKSKFICGTIAVLFNTWIHLHIMYLYVRQHKSTLTNAGLEQIKSILRASFQGLKRVFCNLFLRVLWQSQMYTYIYIYLNIYQIIYCYYTCIEISMTCYLMDTNLPCTLFLLFAARENSPISNQWSPSVNSTASGGYRRHRRHDRSRRISTIGSYKRSCWIQCWWIFKGPYTTLQKFIIAKRIVKV